MIYAPIPIKEIPYCPLLDEEYDENNVYNGIILKNKIITRTKSLKIKKKKIIKGYGISKKFTNNLLFNTKHILYVNNKLMKTSKLYKIDSNTFIDNNKKKYLIKEINKNQFKIYNIIHNVIEIK